MSDKELLSKELLELQLGQIDLLTAMYAAEEEAISIEEPWSTVVEKLKDWCAGDSETPPRLQTCNVQMLLKLRPLGSTAELSRTKVLVMDVFVPVAHEAGHLEDSLEAPPSTVKMRQPTWISKADFAQLVREVSDGDLLDTIEHMQEAAHQYILRSQEQPNDAQGDAAAAAAAMDEPIVRVWFYFPSISTRTKRDDLINHAPTYGLTGFLLAGKPGVLCVEGISQQVDDYMKFIKTESWGDIPAHHKKVSERYREKGGQVIRAFADMQEITDQVGERRGERANRQDMKALEAWLTQRGLGDAFTKVFI